MEQKPPHICTPSTCVCVCVLCMHCLRSKQTEFSTEALPMDTKRPIKVIGITHVNLTVNLQIALGQTVNVTQNYLLMRAAVAVTPRKWITSQNVRECSAAYVQCWVQIMLIRFRARKTVKSTILYF